MSASQTTAPGGGSIERMLTRPLLAASFLIAVTVLAYLPVIRGGGFIWDDDAYVTANPLLRSASGLRDIWTKVGPRQGGTPQYYPLVFSVFWAQKHFWQDRPLGYHLLNVLLHALSAVLVWRILRRLRVPGALLAAAIFALHPVHVESVAWVTELKNVQSCLFYLLALLCYLRFLGRSELELGPAVEDHRGRWPFFFMAILLFLGALASKTVAATLPATILLILWWKTGRVRWQDILLTAPMLALGVGLGLLTAYLEAHVVGAQGRVWTLAPVERCLVAGRALWFYAGKLIWPSGLTFIYPRWEVSQAVWWQYLFPLAALAVMAALWSACKRIGRGPLAAVLFFAGTLFPALGFLNVYPMRFSYVADHFQYPASLGLIALFAAAAVQACRRGGAGPWKLALPEAGMLLLTLGVLTWRQGGVYKDAEQVWIDTIAKNPACGMAHSNLGLILEGEGKAAEAVVHYQETLRLQPDSEQARNNLCHALMGQGRMAEAAAHCQEALRLQPDSAPAHNSWGSVLAKQGKAAEAVAQYREALRLQPDYAEACFNLGTVLDREGRLGEAVVQYREALRLKPDAADVHDNLGVALAKQGELQAAQHEWQEALSINPGDESARRNLDILQRKMDKR